MTQLLPPVHPIPIKDRLSMLWIERGNLDVQDGTFMLYQADGGRVQIPVGGIVCIFMEPGIRISHAAAALAGRLGTLLVWVGEGGVRLYSAGQPGGARASKLLYQAQLALNPETRLKVVGKMYEMRFGEPPPGRRSIEQLRGLEGARVRNTYKTLAQRYGVLWAGRRYDPSQWGEADIGNRCISSATSCLYGVTEAAVLAAGYAPAIGFLHWGRPLAFVYDIADLVKFETVVPAAFKIAHKNPHNPEREVRHACRDMFRQTDLLRRLIPLMEEVLNSGGLKSPEPEETAPEGVPPVFHGAGSGDAGHRG